MQVLACLNGEIMPVEEAKVSVWDRGFVFGDSVYEVFRMYHGRCWLEAEHLARFGAAWASWISCARSQADDGAGLQDGPRSGIQEGTLYIQISRGVAPRSHPFPHPPVPPTEVIIVRPYDDGPTRGSARPGCR